MYDVIVIGSGSAGMTTAGSLNEAGWKTAIIDERPFGGTCALRGCDPKKVLIHASEVLEQAQRLKGIGLEGSLSIHWEDLMNFKRTFVQEVPETIEQSLKDSGIDTLHGRARFIDHETIELDGRQIKSKKFVLATGASPAELPVEGAGYMLSSDDFLELDHLPSSIVFIGGGYISFEFAHLAKRAGADVHILQRGGRALKGFDTELVEKLIDYSESIGVHVHLHTEAAEIIPEGQGYKVHAEKEGTAEMFYGDIIVHGSGRTPNVKALELENAGAAYDEKHGITVNEYLQNTTNENIYAAGDCADTSGSPLTPLAGFEAGYVSTNLLENNSTPVHYGPIASAAFTVPGLTAVGMTGEKASTNGLSIVTEDVSSWFTYKHKNEKTAFVKLIIDKERDTVVGAHALNSDAASFINYMTLVIQHEIPASSLSQTMFAYPTNASDLQYFV
ncbi:dihydrolipoyl dehydrogenase family protein [Marinococcus halophilus]|uniref:dihydrolipoyl dehydrogenase family protein n=1 Tax=Marinococcus halophilus TaxID=1371 RepID=UPI0009A672A9|nr:NAD(P)/FAD-dependent oxidoreductase [Marinococcus halophilus]